jgi:hypothetical protein
MQFPFEDASRVVKLPSSCSSSCCCIIILFSNLKLYQCASQTVLERIGAGGSQATIHRCVIEVSFIVWLLWFLCGKLDSVPLAIHVRR